MMALQAIALTLALSVASTTATCEKHGDGVGFQDCNDSQENLNLLQTKMALNRASASSELELEDDGKPKPPPKPKPVKGPMFAMGIDNGASCIDAVPGPKGATYTPGMCCPPGYEDVKVSVSCAAATASLGINTGKWTPFDASEEAKRITFGGILRKDIDKHPFGCVMFKFKPNPKKPNFKFKVMFNPGAGDIFGNDIREVAAGKLEATDKVICQKIGAQIGQSTGGGAGYGLSVPKIKKEAYEEGYKAGYEEAGGDDEDDEEDDEDEDDEDEDDDEGDDEGDDEDAEVAEPKKKKKKR